ncbi:EthD domain-containing protein [Sphingobium sp.]|uniref:EthD domain-containing protein n=1 Tax=Sphingobium sp. TaxID=1912891 RepID=UPI0028BEC122|nr:EthD domain-containing protein [Sphingobium sp.]
MNKSNSGQATGASFKLALLLVRRADLSREAFATAWIKARKAEGNAPGLLRRVYNAIAADGDMPIHTASTFRVDGIEEMWFDSRASADACLAVIARDMQSGATWELVDRRRVMAVGGNCHLLIETPPRQPDESVKLLLLAVRRAGMTVADFRDYWLHHHGQLAIAAPGAQEYHRRVEYCPIDALSASPFADTSFDGLATIQFHGQAELQAALCGDYYRDVLAPDEPRFSDRERSFGTPVKEIPLYPV